MMMMMMMMMMMVMMMILMTVVRPRVKTNMTIKTTAGIMARHQRMAMTGSGHGPSQPVVAVALEGDELCLLDPALVLQPSEHVGRADAGPVLVRLRARRLPLPSNMITQQKLGPGSRHWALGGCGDGGEGLWTRVKG
jgi:hypothetical protein